MNNQLTPVLFIPHGGGPLPLLGEANHRGMVTFLKEITTRIPNPKAVVVISAHWEASVATVTSAGAPGLIYDYSGFPEDAYRIQYPAPGNPALAEKIERILGEAGLVAKFDVQRGFDHGVFVPMKLMFPDADIPCVQVSLLKSLNPIEHIELGKALNELRTQNVLILGSGFSFHNLRVMMSGTLNGKHPENIAFEDWLDETCCDTSLESLDRENRLINWEQAPGARFCHPREEHFLPLHVCAAAAGFSMAERVFFEPILGAWTSGYLWQ